MSQPRFLRPAFVVAVGERFLVVDEIQPIAVMVDPSINVCGVASWNDLPVPNGSTWPRRRVVSSGERTWVTDFPSGESVVLTYADHAGLVAEEGSPSNLEQMEVQYSRYSLAIHEATLNCASWACRTDTHGFDWVSNVSADLGSTRLNWNLGAGSITSVAFSGGIAAVCVRRAGKRPWRFAPSSDLYVLHGQEGSSTDPNLLRLPSLDVSSKCWEPKRAIDGVAVISEYLPYSLAEFRAAQRHEARNVRLCAASDHDGPVVQLSFELEEFPDIGFVRTDRLIDELGNMSGGLRDLGIFLEEDLAAHLPQVLLGTAEHSTVQI